MLQNTLDLQTVIFVISVLSFLMAMVMTYIWFFQRTYSGFGYWTISNICCSIGFLMIGMRGTFPDFVSISIGNALLCGALLVNYEGARKFLGFHDTRYFSLGVISFYIILNFYFSNLVNDAIARMVLSSVVVTMIGYSIFHIYFIGAKKYNNVAYRSAGMLYLAFVVVTIVRLFVTYSFYREGTWDLFAPDWKQSVVFIFYACFIILWTFGFVIVNSQRLHAELLEVESELMKLAATDDLTGLNNKRRFTEIAFEETRRSRRQNLSMTLIMFDIDRFKSINDEFGHACGDKVLSEVAGICKARLRSIDVIGRLGGEEFAVILPDTDIAGGKLVAESLRKTIAQNEFEFMGKSIHLTSSFGVAVLNENDTPQTLIHRVDKLLYAAKGAGRNCVVVENEFPPIRLVSRFETSGRW